MGRLFLILLLFAPSLFADSMGWKDGIEVVEELIYSEDGTLCRADYYATNHNAEAMLVDIWIERPENVQDGLRPSLAPIGAGCRVYLGWVSPFVSTQTTRYTLSWAPFPFPHR